MLTWSLGCTPVAGQGRDHLVGVHVRRGARAGLEHVDRELVVVRRRPRSRRRRRRSARPAPASSSPSDAFTRAAAPLIRPSQCTTATGIGSPETGKLSTALRVSPPQSSAMSPALLVCRSVPAGQLRSVSPAADPAAPPAPGTTAASPSRAPPRWPGEVDGSTNSGRPSSSRACSPWSGRSPNAPAYACLPTNANAPGCRSRATAPSRRAASAKSVRRSSPLPRVTRRAALVSPRPSASSSSCCEGSSRRDVRPASASSRQKSLRGLAKWNPASADFRPGVDADEHAAQVGGEDVLPGGRSCPHPRRRLLGRVLRLHLLAADAGDAVVRGDRRLREADRDQRDLALVAGDVAGRVDAGQVRLACSG